MTGPGVIYGQLDGIAQDAQGLQEVSDTQASLVQGLANTMEGLGVSLRGMAGNAMQQVGEQLRHQGTMFSTEFADHSQKMSNNGQVINTADEEHAHMISQVGNLIV